MLREMRKMRTAMAPKKKSRPPPPGQDLAMLVTRIEEAVASQDYVTRDDLGTFKTDVDRRFESQGVVLREIEVCVRRLEGRMER